MTINSIQLLDRDGSDAQEQFMARVYDRLGSSVLPRELEDLGLENTPQYDPYEDETQNKQSFPQIDHYIVADILLLRGFKMARGHVVAKS